MKAEHTKERILSEALTLFAQKGYEAVSVEEIAAAVGIKAPSLYKHYKGKRDIFDHIVTHMNQQDAARAQALRLPHRKRPPCTPKRRWSRSAPTAVPSSCTGRRNRFPPTSAGC